MAQPIDFLFYLGAKNGVNYDYYSIVGGVFTTTTSATPINPLQFAPKDWNNIQLTLSRNLTSKGVFRNISETFKFVKDGAKILRKKHFEGGVNAKVELLIMKFNRSGAVYAYENYFIGAVDFLTANNEKSIFSVNVKEAGFLSKYETRKATKYKIPITDNVNAKWVHFDGINLQAIFSWVQIGAGAKNPSNNIDVYPLFAYTNTEGQNLYSLTYDIDAVAGATSLVKNDSSNNVDYNIKYEGSLITLKTTGASSFAHIIVRLRDSAGVLVAGFTPLFISGSLPISVNNVIPFSIDQTINVPAGHSLEISVIMRDAVFPAGTSYL